MIKKLLPSLCGLILLSLITACSAKDNTQAQSSANTNNSPQSSQPMTPTEEAANSLYLQDAVDSAVNSDITADTDTNTSSDTGEESSVVEDMQTRRLEQMANMLMDTYDTNKDGYLTLTEFLAWPQKRFAADPQAAVAAADSTDTDSSVATSTDISNATYAAFQQKIITKFTDDFNKFAITVNQASVLDVNALISLLKAQAPRVSKERNSHFRGMDKQRLQQSWDSIKMSQFNKSPQEQLSQGEIQQYVDAQGQKENQWRRRDPQFGHRGNDQSDTSSDTVLNTDTQVNPAPGQ